MEKTQTQISYQKSGLSIAAKVFAIIDIVLDSLLLIAGIAGFVLISIFGKQGSSQQQQQVIQILRLVGIIGLAVGIVALGVSITSLVIINTSDSFALALTFGIINILTGVGIVTGILLILVACIDNR